MRAALAVIACAGCSQILGLQNTKFDFKDAMVDAPSVCDGAPACTSTTGRSACGYLVATGANAGVALHVASPTGGACTGTEGPCAFAVYGQSEADFFGGAGTNQVPGTIDDCGRFVVPDLPSSDANVAIVFTGSDAQVTALLVLDRPTMSGTDTGLVAYPVTAATQTAWGTQLSTTLAGGYLVLMADAMKLPQASEVVWVDGGPIQGPPATPWSAYFAGDKPFGMLDASVRETGASGAAMVVPQNSSFMLGGAKLGRTCKQIAVQLVGSALIEVTLSC